MTDLIRHWYLNLAVELHLPVRMLTRDDLGLALNVRPLPGYSGSMHLKCLLRLVKDGDLAVWAQRMQADALVLADELEALICAGSINNLSFGLTERGAAAWEAFSLPNWSKLIVEASDLTELELKSTSFDNLMGYLGWVEVSRGIRVDWSSIRRTEQYDSEIFYWKLLPRLHIVTMNIEESTESREKWFAAPGWVSMWSRTTSEWYVPPWDRPEWADLVQHGRRQDQE